MKILRIKTVNLNSLYGPQEVDLEGTLGGASLFLIFGPTGAGKSTLMDAVSLALFGKTPRLDKSSKIDSDPRAIMSRATGECMAEVEFSKLEQSGRVRYRATWSCRRARGRSDRPLQSPKRSLERLSPGQPKILISSAKKKDFKPVFEELLEGFGVEDFNRSMLLAQGQFDAFLGAAPGVRAAILERLTDTSDYRVIGDRAAQLHSRHQSHIKKHEALCEHGGGLGAEELAALKELHATRRAALDAKQKAQAESKTHLDWVDGELSRKSELQDATNEQELLVTDQAAAKEELQSLADYERCAEAGAFAALTARTGAQTQVTELQTKLSELDKALPLLAAERAKLQSQVASTEQSAASAGKSLEALRPLADAAKSAAAAARSAGEIARKTKKEHGQTASTTETAAKALAQSSLALKDAKERATKARDELARRSLDAEFAAGWPPLRTRLDQLIARDKTAATEAKKLTKRRSELEAELLKFTAEQAEHEASREQLLGPREQALASAKAALEALQSQPDLQASRQELLTTVSEARNRRELIQQSIAPVESVERSAKELAELKAQNEILAGSLEALKAELAGKTLKRNEATEEQDRKHREFERLRLVASLVEQRAELTDEQECPLCGSEEHPWHGDPERAAADAIISETLAATEAELAQLSVATDEAQTVLRQSEDKSKELSTKRELQSARAAELGATLAKLQSAAAKALAAAELAPESSAAQVGEALEAALASLEKAEKQQRALEAAKSLTEAAELALRTLSEQQAQRSKELAERGTVLGERGEQLCAADAAQAEAAAHNAQERSGCREQLSAGGLTLDSEAPSKWRKRAAKRVEEHEGRIAALTVLEAEIKTLSAENKGALTLHAELAKRLAELAASLAKQETEQAVKQTLATAQGTALRAAWEAVLALDERRPQLDLPKSDTAPEALIAAQKLWFEQAQAAAKIANNKQLKAQQRVKDAETKRETLRGQKTEREEALVAAKRALDTILAALELASVQELDSRRLSDPQLQGSRTKRKALDIRRLQIETKIRERRERIGAHAKLRPEGLAAAPERAELAAALILASAEAKAAAESHQETRDKLRDHDRAVQDQQESREKLEEAKKKASIWQTLHSYIGINNGEKFKEFAQALNLGQLLAKANHHLALLAPRYRLLPREIDGLPSLEFDLDDLWQVGQRVAPRSLSGGERFLVSLSLALGLSDFRSVKMPIETLLLDEGFGTLDPASLDIALGALSQLQAGGRQVGIISHVVGLQERIEARIEVRPLGGGRSTLKTPE